jgi:PAS domain S-box-containing protein
MSSDNTAFPASFNHQVYRDFLNLGVVNAMAVDESGLIVFANKAELDLACYDMAEITGKPLSYLYSSEDGFDLQSLLLSGTEVKDIEACINCKNGTTNTVLISTQTIIDVNNITNLYIFSRDISLYKKNERLLSYLNTAAEELAQARDTQSALQKISNLIVPKFANWFTIDILKDNSLELLILAHEDPKAIEWAYEYRKNNPVDLSADHGSALVLKTGKPNFVPVVTHDMIASRIQDAEKLKIFENLGMQSVIAVAIHSKQDISGVITFISTEAGKHYDETDLKFAQNFANHISLALDNARLNEAAAIEIQQRKQIEDKLKITQAQLRSALSSGLVGTWTYDPDNNIAYLDENLSKLLGVPYKSDGTDPRLFWNLMHDEDRSAAEKKRKKVEKNGGIYEAEYRLILNGQTHWFFVRGKKERYDTENTALLTGVLIDVTELKKTEFALKQSEDVFRLIAETLPQKLFVTDSEGNIDYYNPQWEHYTGHSIEEISKLTLTHFIHPDDLEKNLEKWAEAVKSGDDFQYEHRFRQKDGEYRWHLTRALSLKDERGNILKWIGSVTDIHDRKLNEQRKDEFISIASHELRTPLTTVKAFFQLAKKNLSPQERTFGFIDKAGKQLERLEKLISDLLDVSKINAGKMVYNMEPFIFDDAMAEAVESVQLTSGSHNITVERGAPIVYTGDKLRIEQVIINFLTNAVKYSPDSDKILVRSEVQGNNIILSVQDYGIGIAPENLTDLFDRFYRVDNTSMRYQGLGLGLFIASEIIKRHNGSFWIESEPGLGSTFYFLLPISGRQEFIDVKTDNQTYYKGNFIEISYNPQMEWLDVDWFGYQNYDSVKKGCLIMLDLLIKNNCSKVLNDNTHVLGNWSEAVDWGSEVWFPAMQKAGLKFFAWIYSPSTFSRISAQKSIDVALGNITAQFFMDINEATIWLQNK